MTDRLQFPVVLEAFLYEDKIVRSMDIDFHDNTMEQEVVDNDRNDEAVTGEPAEDNSFGEASDSCEPDHEFLEQALEDCHPERLNLLDPTVPESVYKKKPRKLMAFAQNTKEAIRGSVSVVGSSAGTHIMKARTMQPQGNDDSSLNHLGLLSGGVEISTNGRKNTGDDVTSTNSVDCGGETIIPGERPPQRPCD